MADRILAKPFDDPALELARLQVLALHRIEGKLEQIRAAVRDDEDDYGAGHYVQKIADGMRWGGRRG